MDKRWGWVVVVFVALAASRCGFDGDICGSESQGPCTQKPVAGTHAVDVYSGYCGGCVVQCETGWLDCDNDVSNGCETPGVKCPSSPFSDSGAPRSATILSTLSGAPRGLAVCGANVFYFDDSDLFQLSPSANPKKLATSPDPPAGGIACDGTFLYWASSAAPDGGTAGTMWELPIWASSPTALATGIDPAPGVDLRGTSAYWIQRTTDAGSMLAHTTGDAGWSAIMPASATSVYKPFALTSNGDYAIDQGTIWFNSLAQDAGGPAQVAAGTSALALFAGSSPSPYVVSSAMGDDLIQQLLTDAGTHVPTIVAVAAAGTTAILASDDAVYAFDLQTRTVSFAASPALHVVDVAIDNAKRVYWTTRGEGVTLGAVWTMQPP